MSLAINNRIWELAEKLYIHCYETGGFVDLLSSHEINLPNNFYDGFEIYSFMSTDQNHFANFMQSVPAYRYIPLLQDILFDEDGRVANTQRDNWNYYGAYIREWYPEIIRLLNQIEGVEINTQENRMFFQEVEFEGDLDIRDFLDFNFVDPFLEHMKKEINECHNGGQYLAVMVLSRKLIECLILRILRKVFWKHNPDGTYNATNHALWADLDNNYRVLGLGNLIENLKNNSANFHDDKELVEDICARIKPVKREMDKCVHYDHKIPDADDVAAWNIPKISNMLGKIFREYCNP